MNSKKLGLITLSLLLTIIGFKALSTSQTLSFEFISKNKELEKIVQDELKGAEGEFAISIEELDNSKNSYGFNDKVVMPSASLYKLYLMAAVLKQVETGNLKLEDTLKAEKSYLDEKLGGEENGYKDYRTPIEYSVDEGLIRIGRISDNYAAIMLSDLVTQDKIEDMVAELGSKSTSFRTEYITTTSGDTLNFFKKLYKGEVVSQNVSNQIIKYLEYSQLNTRIPALLPEGTRVVHKTGELSRLRHDGGIVYLEGRPYVIVLMATDVKYEDQTIDLEARISKKVFDYFSNKR